MPFQYDPSLDEPFDQAQLPDLRKPLKEWEKGARAFVDETQGMAGGLVALGAEGLKRVAPEVARPTLDKAVQWGMDTYRSNMEEATAGLQAPKVADIRDIKSVGDFGDWAAYNVTKGLGTVATFVGTGGIAGGIAKATANQALKTAVKSAAAGKVSKEAGQLAADQLSKRFAKGATAGVLGAGFGMEGGAAFGQMVDEGTAPADALLPAATVGAINAALEFLPFGMAAKALGIGVPQVKQGIIQTIKNNPEYRKKALSLANIAKKAGVGAAAGVATEGLTEGLQELVNIAGDRWAKDEKIFDSLTEEQRWQIANAAAAGAAVGGTVGAPVGAVRGVQERVEAKRYDEEAKAAEAQAAQQAAAAQATAGGVTPPPPAAGQVPPPVGPAPVPGPAAQPTPAPAPAALTPAEATEMAALEAKKQAEGLSLPEAVKLGVLRQKAGLAEPIPEEDAQAAAERVKAALTKDQLPPVEDKAPDVVQLPEGQVESPTEAPAGPVPEGTGEAAAGTAGADAQGWTETVDPTGFRRWTALDGKEVLEDPVGEGYVYKGTTFATLDEAIAEAELDVPTEGDTGFVVPPAAGLAQAQDMTARDLLNVRQQGETPTPFEQINDMLPAGFGVIEEAGGGVFSVRKFDDNDSSDFYVGDSYDSPEAAYDDFVQTVNKNPEAFSQKVKDWKKVAGPAQPAAQTPDRAANEAALAVLRERAAKQAAEKAKLATEREARAQTPVAPPSAPAPAPAAAAQPTPAASDKELVTVARDWKWKEVTHPFKGYKGAGAGVTHINIVPKQKGTETVWQYQLSGADPIGNFATADAAKAAVQAALSPTTEITRGQLNAIQNPQAAQPDGNVQQPRGPEEVRPVPAAEGGAGVPVGGQRPEVSQAAQSLAPEEEGAKYDRQDAQKMLADVREVVTKMEGEQTPKSELSAAKTMRSGLAEATRDGFDFTKANDQFDSYVPRLNAWLTKYGIAPAEKPAAPPVDQMEAELAKQFVTAVNDMTAAEKAEKPEAPARNLTKEQRLMDTGVRALNMSGEWRGWPSTPIENQTQDQQERQKNELIAEGKAAKERVKYRAQDREWDSRYEDFDETLVPTVVDPSRYTGDSVAVLFRQLEDLEKERKRLARQAVAEQDKDVVKLPDNVKKRMDEVFRLIPEPGKFDTQGLALAFMGAMQKYLQEIKPGQRILPGKNAVQAHMGITSEAFDAYLKQKELQLIRARISDLWKFSQYRDVESIKRKIEQYEKTVPPGFMLLTNVQVKPGGGVTAKVHVESAMRAKDPGNIPYALSADAADEPAAKKAVKAQAWKLYNKYSTGVIEGMRELKTLLERQDALVTSPAIKKIQHDQEKVYRQIKEHADAVLQVVGRELQAFDPQRDPTEHWKAQRDISGKPGMQDRFTVVNPEKGNVIWVGNAASTEDAKAKAKEYATKFGGLNSVANETVAVPIVETRKQLASVFGAGLLNKMEASGLLQIHEGAGPGNASGQWRDGVMHIYAGSMPADLNVAGVALHEGSHAGMEVMLGASFNSYAKDVLTLSQNGDALAKEAEARMIVGLAETYGIQHDLAAMNAAFEQAADKKQAREAIDKELLRVTELIAKQPGARAAMAEELIAYYIQGVAGAGKSSGLFQRIINAIKAWFAQTEFGIAMKRAGLGPQLTDGMALALAQRAVTLAQGLRELELQVGNTTRPGPSYASFVGRQARVRGMANLPTAERRVAAGEDPEMVRQETGWKQGVDGMWRFEISDMDMDWIGGENTFAMMPDGVLFPAKDVLEHNELYRAYPWIEDEVHIARFAGGPNGSMAMVRELQDQNGNAVYAIGINSDAHASGVAKSQSALGSLVHELQHVIQKIEGFAPGGGLLTVRLDDQPSIDKLRAEVRKTNDQVLKNDLAWLDNNQAQIASLYMQYDGMSTAALEAEKEYQRTGNIRAGLIAMAGRQARDMAAQAIVQLHEANPISMRLYSALAGEQEAEATRKRMMLSPMGRRDMAVEDWFTTSPENQIVVPPNTSALRMGADRVELRTKLQQPETLYSIASDVRNLISSMPLYSKPPILSKEFFFSDPTSDRVESVNNAGVLDRALWDVIDAFEPIKKKHSVLYDLFDLMKTKKSAEVANAHRMHRDPLVEKISAFINRGRLGPDGKKIQMDSKWIGDRLAAWHIVVDDVNRKAAEGYALQYARDLETKLSVTNVKMPSGNKMVSAANKMRAERYALMQAGLTNEQLRYQMKMLVDKYMPYEKAEPDEQGTQRQFMREKWEHMKDHASGFSTGEGNQGIIGQQVQDAGIRNAHELYNEVKDDKEFQKIQQMVNAVARQKLDVLLEGGLITQEEFAKLSADKSAYVPLRREAFSETLNEVIQNLLRTGRGGGKQLSTRAGTEALMGQEPAYVVQNAVASLDASIAAAERNKVLNSFAEDVWAGGPMADWFRVQEHGEYVSRDKHGFIEEKPSTQQPPLGMHFIRKGKHLVIVPKDETNDRAVQIARAVNNLDATEVGGLLRGFQHVNSWVRFVNITVSPAFILANMIRDPFTAAYNLKATEADGHIKDIFGEWKNSIKALHKVFVKGIRDPNDPDVQKIVAWEKAGGRISFVESLKQMDQSLGSFEKDLQLALGEVKSKALGIDIKSPKIGKGLSKVKAGLEWIENMNIMFENAMRLSAFTVLTRAGLDKNRAARISKDITTNFSRKGNKSQALGAWWLFFNATVQGNYQVWLNAKASKKLQGLIAGTVAFSFLMDQFARAISDDDDDDGRSNWDSIPEWDKERNIHFPFQVGGVYAKIPAPWVYNVFWRTGQMISEMVSGQRDLPSLGADWAGMALTTFNPLGAPGSIAQAVAPTALDPLVQVYENKTPWGTPIGPEQFPGAGQRPQSQLSFGNVPEEYKYLAEMLNEFTGGNVAESGLVDLKPGDYKLLADFVLGSAGRFVAESFSLPGKVVSDKEMQVREVPALKIFASEATDPMESKLYHERLAKVFGAEKAEKLYRGPGPEQDFAALQKLRQDRALDLQMVRFAKDAERQIKSLRQRMRAAEGRGDDAGVEMYKKRIEEVRQRFNQTYARRAGN